MKNELIKIFLFFLCFLINSTYAQKLYARYESVSIFSKLSKPLSIGIFDFEGNEVFEEQLLEEIGKAIIVRENFIFYPSETLKSLQEDFEIKSLNSNDLDCLHKLKDKLNIQLILIGKEATNNDLQIDFVDTETGKIIFSNVYRSSKNSTILNDLIKLFTDQKTTIYKREIKNLPEMVLVERGEIVTRPMRYTIDTIKVRTDFFISKYECTVKQFAEFIKMTDYKTDAENEGYSIINSSDNDLEYDSMATWKCDEIGAIRPGYDSLDYPVVHISWNDAIKYCEWLSNETGDKYRLPDYTEWEFASFGGTHSKFFAYSGSDVLNDVGWYKDNSVAELNIVGIKILNEIGLCDMSGNVREWCFDLFKTDDSRRIVANGSWLDNEIYCKNIYRHRWQPNFRSNIIGFRVLKEIQQNY